MLEEGSTKHFPSILVLVAALNEELGLRLTLAELKKYLNFYRVLVVDGNSCDKTVSVAASMGAEVLCQIGKGKGKAIASALRYLTDDFEYAVLIDADYTYPAEYIPSMIKILETNSQVGMVCGNRFNSYLDLGAMGNVYHFGNRAIAFTHNILNGIAMKDPLTGLRVVRWNLLKKWQPRSGSFDIEVELNHHIERKNYQIIEIPIIYRERIGKKKLKLRHGLTIMGRILAERFS